MSCFSRRFGLARLFVILYIIAIPSGLFMTHTNISFDALLFIRAPVLDSTRSARFSFFYLSVYIPHGRDKQRTHVASPLHAQSFLCHIME